MTKKKGKKKGKQTPRHRTDRYVRFREGFGPALRVARKAAGLSIGDAVGRTGGEVTYQTWHYTETGGQASLYHTLRMCEAVGVPLAALLPPEDAIAAAGPPPPAEGISEKIQNSD